MTPHLPVLLIAFALCHTTVGFAADGPAKDVPELEALSNYIGTWDVVITSEDSPFTKGESTTKWILDGRFVEQSGHIASDDGATTLKITTLMTYDRNEKAYRMWSFLSNGETSESTGKWDAKNRTMTSIRRGGGSTTTTTARFGENGTEEWTMVTKDQNGEVVIKFGGKNTRHKK